MPQHLRSKFGCGRFSIHFVHSDTGCWILDAGCWIDNIVNLINCKIVALNGRFYTQQNAMISNFLFSGKILNWVIENLTLPHLVFNELYFYSCLNTLRS